MTMRLVLVTAAALLIQAARAGDRVELFADDFSKFAPGVLSAPLFKVTATAAAATDLRARVAARDSALAQLRAGNPQPTLWKKFDTPLYGAGRNVRFGDLAAAVHDLTGDPRDEIVLWDQQRVWVYTQDRPFTGTRIYRPARNPNYNDSNYRATVSLPGWQPVAPPR